MEVVSETEVRAFARHLASVALPSRGARAREWISPNTRAMEWATRRPGFKTRLFRFVDVVPACRDASDTASHLAEYLQHPDSPMLVRTGLRLTDRLPGGDRLATGTATFGIRQMARQFIIGADLPDVVERLAQLWEAGFANTLDLLGEKTLTDIDADSYARRVGEALGALTDAAPRWPQRSLLENDPWGGLPRVNVSVKPSALSAKITNQTMELGVAQAADRLEPILEAAGRSRVTIHLDAEHDETKDATHALLREIGRRFPDGPNLGCVIQAYRQDAADDLADLIRWSADSLAAPLQVRLVKGAYWDAETITARANGWENPLFEVKSRSDANYERCAQEMVAAAGDIRPAFASHNIRSLAYAVTAAHAAGLEDHAFELQVLYGMAQPLHDAVRDLGFRTRVYAPMGELIPGMAYLVRRLLENTANESFVRQRFTEGRAIDQVIGDPAQAGLADSANPTASEHRPVDEEGPVSPSRSTSNVTVSFRNEPVAELRRQPVRARLAAAVAEVDASLGFRAPLLIGGEAVWTADVAPSSDPGKLDRLVCRSALAGPEHVDRAVATAVGALANWGRRSVHERAAVLLRAADLLRRRRYELAALIVFEAGKPLAEADADVCEAIDFLTYYARSAVELEETPLGQVPGEHNELRYRPRGVGVVIAPWNFPLAIPTGMVAGALATGNTVIFKPAEQTPGVGLRLVQTLHEAGVPLDALTFLPGIGEDVGPHLVEHPDIAFVAFTGSRAVGLDIVERAAPVRPGQRVVKQVIAEMGGKNPVIIDADADLDVAVPAVVKSAFGYAGQKCSAASRLLVVGPVFEQLIERLSGAIELLTIDHPSSPAADLGPLIDEDAFKRVVRYRELAASEGRIVAVRDDVPDNGWYVGPMLAVVDDPLARVATEEIFGPLLTAVWVPDFDAAIDIANHSDYALTAGVFTRTPSHIEEAARRLDAGNLYVNRGTTGAMVARQPFGGFKLSGTGVKAGGPGYLAQFTTSVVVSENTQRQGFAPDL